MNLWQRILLRLGIASTKLVGADNETFALGLAEDQAELVAWQRAVISDLIRVAYKIDPELGNAIKLQWISWLQRTDP